MNPSPENREFDYMREFLLSLPYQRQLQSLLNLVVESFARRDPAVALARIWLVGPGDRCDSCALRSLCPDQTECLHLAAECYKHPPDDPSTLAREFERIPLGVGKAGRSATTGRQEDLESLAADIPHAVSRSWAQQANILGLGVTPLLQQGRVLGVIGACVVKEAQVEGEGLFWTRLVADSIAASIANVRAFEEIQRLKERLERDNEYLSDEILESQAYGEIIGQSPSLKNVAEQIGMVAGTDANVLINGESGTGKELVAREIHKRSTRSLRPLIKVNCASIPKDLYESEFFGHVKGAFTGAVQDRRGRFELADGATLFLDEVGEVPLDLQSKLLRVLQEGEYERIGDARTRKCDVRIIAATNRDLKGEIIKGRFREDLYYRLNVFPIELPSLRERPEDIPLLAEHFLRNAGKKFNKPVKPPTAETIAALKNYLWPGNVRELQNVLERAVITSRRGELKLDLDAPAGKAPSAPRPESAADAAVLTEAELKRLERDNTLRALKRCDGKIFGPNGAAKLLGVKPTTLATRMKALGLKKTYSVRKPH